MKEEIKSWIASILILWAIKLDPEQVMEIPALSENQKLIHKIKSLADLHNWKFKSQNEKSNLISFTRSGNRMDVYYKNKSRMSDFNLTVSTSMNHPTKGKTQLHRKQISQLRLIKLLINPREHTNRGYYKKN